MSLRKLYKNPDYDWMTKAKETENLARTVAKNLFLFDNFVEKEIDDLENASDQLIYTYTIINLYGLFFDSGKIINSPDGVFQTNLASPDRLYISKFYAVLQELRSIICHNKPKDSLKLNNLKLLGNVEMRNFKYLRTYRDQFSYEDAFKYLTKNAMTVLEILSNFIKKESGADEETKENFVKEWYDSITSKWNTKELNELVLYRAAYAFYSLNPKRVRDYVKMKEGKQSEDMYSCIFFRLIKSQLPPKCTSDYWKKSYGDHFCNAANYPRDLSPLNAMLDIFDKVIPY